MASGGAGPDEGHDGVRQWTTRKLRCGQLSLRNAGGERNEMVGYVYVLEAVSYSVGESGPWTKIGCSKNPPEWRVGTNLKRGNPRDLCLAVVYEFDTEQGMLDAEGTRTSIFSNLP